MQIRRALISMIALSALLAAAAGCGSKAARPGASAGETGEAASSSARQSASASASPSVKPSSSPSAAPSYSPAASPSPSPSPSPTPPAVGTIVDGWVVGIPDYVPRFPCGTIDRDQSKILQGSAETVFTLCFRGVARADLDAYVTALKSAGFTAAAEEINATYTLTASLGGDWNKATLVITLFADGTATYSLDVSV